MSIYIQEHLPSHTIGLLGNLHRFHFLLISFGSRGHQPKKNFCMLRGEAACRG